MMMIGSVPPPVHGVSLYLSRLLKSPLKNKIRLDHFDISDHRDLTNIGSFDLRNIVLACIQMVRLSAKLITGKYDYVYIPVYMNFAGFLRDSFFIFIVKLFSGARILPHFHCDQVITFYESAPFYHKWIINITFRMLDRVIVLSHGLKRGFLKWFSEEKIRVLSNGLDICWNFNRKTPPGKNIRITFLGNFVPKKGIMEALQVFALISDEFPHVRCCLGGKWDEKYSGLRKRVHELVVSRNLGGRIKFAGAVNDDEKMRLFEETDIFLFPSWTEGMPTVIIEALAAGCPVISTRVGAVPEMVEESRNGFLLDAGDIAGMADKIRFLLNHPEQIRLMGEASKKIYHSRFTFNAVMRDFEMLLGLKL